MFVALLCMLLAFVVNVLLVSQQNVGFMLQAQPKGQQDELQFHYEALRDADHHKTQVLAHMSHQIKSPLQGMLGLLDMLRGTGLDAKQRSSVDTIIANCQSMRLMLDDIHTYAKLEAGQLTLATEEFLIDECLRDLSSVYEIAAEEQQNEFSTQIELPARLRVQGDRRRIHRVLSHLLSESIYRTQKGRIRFQASLLPDGSLCFTVESQRGPLDSVHDHEWEFGNTKNWPSLEIFNLKTCQRIVQAMGGRLSMERSGPKANLVTIILPLPTLQPQEASPSVHDSQFQNVLVVDDNAINLSVASGLLIKLGYQVETAANGLQALEKVKQKRYDVIFMDCQMPIMDGYETTRQIRAYSQPEHGPLIIALTANSLSETYEKAIHSGMDRVITKPVSLDILIQTIGYAKAGPGASLTQNPSIMDFKAFYLGLGDDSDLIQTAVTRFFEEIDGVMDRLRDQVEKKDASSLARTAHTLKGMAALFAAHTLVEANRSLEMAGKEERIHEFAALHKRVVTLTELLKMELKHLMDDRNLTGKDVA
jgi:CheY-like chemotaxis protein/HPt (histidine-containing phosphotransfer) domain-containing protein